MSLTLLGASSYANPVQPGGGGGPPTWTFVRGEGTDSGSGTSTLTHVFSTNVTSGNVIVVCFTYSSPSSKITSIVDTVGTTYIATPAASGSAAGFTIDSGNGQCFHCYYGFAAGSGANTITVTLSETEDNKGIAVVEFSCDLTAAYDASDGAFDATGSTGTDGDVTPSITTTTNGDLLVGCTMGTSTGTTAWTAGTNFTERIEITAASGSGPEMETRVQATAGSGTNATWTASDTSQYCSFVVAFKGT